jgi:AraC family transcriptional regulator
MITYFTSIPEPRFFPPSSKIIEDNTQSNGFTVRRYNTRSLDITQLPKLHHALSFNCGDPFFMSWKAGQKWAKGMCTTGNVVTLRSSGDHDHAHCFQHYDKLEISFNPNFIDALLEKENFQFHSQYNIQDSLLRDVATKLYEGNLSTRSAEHLYVESLAITCAIHLATNYSTNHKKIFAPKGKLSSHQLKKLIDYVQANIHGVVTLDEMAASVYLSVFHFSRLFKNTVGISPYRFVLNMKIDYSKKLIKSKRPISDIAYALAFTDSAHFCNAFKKHTGYSPLQYNFM